MTDQNKPRLLIVALTIQLSYIGMSVMWNLIGVGLIDVGQQPLGASASMTVVAVMLAVAVLIALSANRVRWLYASASGILALGCLSAIYTAFTGAAELWPSNYFRVFGALINVLGLIGFALACRVIFSAPLNK
ncbi:hypothetical protein N8137_04335 [Porticoccaceae bacterium]|jgi:hypothetical protein|nr:hypothetical protein [Porticoccaceae bacterium]MDB9844360.1 hypothetical protein [Porticoccaceae bacterium]MDC1477324.1 hypothetical protein [Porticoccaceae bacterium]CAI8299217.1 MAG: Uncharacterised protein [SAR92 bacterium MED-G29]|tara:strand:- start:965 stop:1363 length:399 start_codon:yes stop_codon:yes gene_type:complete